MPAIQIPYSFEPSNSETSTPSMTKHTHTHMTYLKFHPTGSLQNSLHVLQSVPGRQRVAESHAVLCFPYFTRSTQVTLATNSHIFNALKVTQ